MSAVETCVNGKEALKLLRDKDKNFDLVLSDVYMPGKLRAAPSISAMPGRGLLAGELVVEMVACMLQTWMASDYWSRSGWRWISQLSVGLLSLQVGGFWLSRCCPVWRLHNILEMYCLIPVLLLQ